MDFYKVLEVSQKATEEELKSSYRRLSKKYHPDVNPGNAEAEKRFQEISEAYGVLGDKEKRKAYDKERRSRDFGAKNTKKKIKARIQLIITNISYTPYLNKYSL